MRIAFSILVIWAKASPGPYRVTEGSNILAVDVLRSDDPTCGHILLSPSHTNKQTFEVLPVKHNVCKFSHHTNMCSANIFCLSWLPDGQACFPSKFQNACQAMFICLAALSVVCETISKLCLRQLLRFRMICYHCLLS